MNWRARVARRHGERAPAPARRVALRAGLLVSLAIAVVGGRAAAATAPPFTIDVGRGDAVFQLGNLAPGPLGYRCLVVSVHNGTADQAFLSATVGGTGLAAYLDLTVDVGTSANPADCSDFVGSTVFAGSVADLGVAHPDPASGVALPFADARSAVVRFTLALRSDNAAQGRTATLELRFDAEDSSTPPTTAPPTTTPSTAPATTAPPATSAPATSSPATTAASATSTSVDASTTTAAPATTTTTSVVVSAGSARKGGPRAEGTPPGRTTTTVAAGAAGATSPADVRDPARPGGSGSSGSVSAAVEQVAQVVSETVTVAAKTSSVPAVFVSFVFAFLIVQDRFDRNDPKLARAPLAPDPELTFVPRLREPSR